jgi:hypothetical protein
MTRNNSHLIRFPNKKTIEDMILKRGYSLVGEERKALTDNKFIEDKLGESTGIICVEDIIHELWNFGPNFKTVSIGPFSVCLNQYGPSCFHETRFAR